MYNRNGTPKRETNWPDAAKLNPFVASNHKEIEEASLKDPSVRQILASVDLHRAAPIASALTAFNILEMAEQTELKRKAVEPKEEEDEFFIRDNSGTPYLYFKRTGSVGIENAAGLGMTLKFISGKGHGTSTSSTRETYRGRTSSELFIQMNLGMDFRFNKVS